MRKVPACLVRCLELWAMQGQGGNDGQSTASGQGWPSAQQAVQAAVNALKPQTSPPAAKAD